MKGRSLRFLFFAWTLGALCCGRAGNKATPGEAGPDADSDAGADAGQDTESSPDSEDKDYSGCMPTCESPNDCAAAAFSEYAGVTCALAHPPVSVCHAIEQCSAQHPCTDPQRTCVLGQCAIVCDPKENTAARCASADLHHTGTRCERVENADSDEVFACLSNGPCSLSTPCRAQGEAEFRCVRDACERSCAGALQSEVPEICAASDRGAGVYCAAVAAEDADSDTAVAVCQGLTCSAAAPCQDSSAACVGGACATKCTASTALFDCFHYDLYGAGAECVVAELDGAPGDADSDRDTELVCKALRCSDAVPCPLGAWCVDGRCEAVCDAQSAATVCAGYDLGQGFACLEEVPAANEDKTCQPLFCQSKADCALERTCLFGLCLEICEDVSECQGEDMGLGFVCQDTPGISADKICKIVLCGSVDVCPDNKTCWGGACVNKCTKASECQGQDQGAGFACEAAEKGVNDDRVCKPRACDPDAKPPVDCENPEESCLVREDKTSSCLLRCQGDADCQGEAIEACLPLGELGSVAKANKDDKVCVPLSCGQTENVCGPGTTCL